MGTEKSQKPLKKQPDKKLSARSKARYAALQALYQWSLNAEPVAEILAQFREEGALDGADKKLFDQLVTGTIKTVVDIDQSVSPHLRRPIIKVDLVEKALLRLGGYELLFQLNVPYRVVLNEYINLSKTFGSSKSHQFVNAALDRLARKVREAEFSAHKSASKSVDKSAKSSK